MKEIKSDLIVACKNKERRAQKELYQILLPFLKPIANRYLRNNQFVLDVLQESFVKIFLEIRQYDKGRGTIKSWAAKIVINKSLNYNNRIIAHHTQEIESIQLADTIDLENEETFTKETLKAILQKMPKGYFEVFNLYVIDGYDHVEIAEILNITASLSRKKLSRAREWFRNSEFLQKIVMFFFLIQMIY